MKSIEQPNPFVPRPDLNLVPGKKPRGKENRPAGFFSLLSSAAVSDEVSAQDDSALSVEKWETQLDSIHRLGDALVDAPGLASIKAYRDAIKAFVEEFTKKGLEMKEYVSNRNVIQQKKYAIIRVIDEKLERLVRDLLASQQKQLEILGRLEEIQGLLVDLIQ